MTDINTTPAAKPGAKIKQTISSAWWVRVMRLAIGALSIFLLYRMSQKLGGGRLSPTDSWIVGLLGTLGLSALVEAIWPEGNHGLLQFWCLTALAASALVSWAAGGAKWLGIFGAVLLALSFVLAVMSSAKGCHTNAP